MKYNCGTLVKLGDVILAQHGQDADSLARVVAIGTETVSQDIDKKFYSWAKSDGILDSNTVVIEWIGDNPLSHEDPKFAPTGNYMTLQSLCCERFIKRGIK